MPKSKVISSLSHYDTDRISKTPHNKEKRLRKTHGNVQKKQQKSNRRMEGGRKGKKQACSAQEKGRKKETDTITFHKVTHLKSGQELLAFHKKQGQKMHIMRGGKQPNMWTSYKKRKEIRKVE